MRRRGLKDDWLALNEEVIDYWFVKEENHSECFDNRHGLKHMHTPSLANFLYQNSDSEVPIPKQKHLERTQNPQVEWETKTRLLDSLASVLIIVLLSPLRDGTGLLLTWEGWKGSFGSVARLSRQPRHRTMSSAPHSTAAQRSLPSRCGVAPDCGAQTVTAVLDTARRWRKPLCHSRQWRGCCSGAALVTWLKAVHMRKSIIQLQERSPSPQLGASGDEEREQRDIGTQPRGVCSSDCWLYLLLARGKDKTHK